jgi:hypothetical protein
LHDRVILIVSQLGRAAKALIDQHRRWTELLLTVGQIRGLDRSDGTILHSRAMKYAIMEPALARRRAPLAATFALQMVFYSSHECAIISQS